MNNAGHLPISEIARRAGKAKAFVQRGRPSKKWIKYSPRTAREAGRLAPILEVAARYVAEAA